ncbi:AGE family epimerase/isomerase [Humibacillus xanthopallidus]|nr:AGE family epimerase/isomerase [Humibacillus xanthopallidus]
MTVAQTKPTNEHMFWLQDQRRQLLQLALSASHPAGGFGWLDGAGGLIQDKGVELWIAARMTHVAALEALQGDPRAADAVDQGVKAFESTLKDHDYGGWFAAIDGAGVAHTDKRAYEHAFVILAAASATASGHPRGRALLDEAVEVFDQRFWRPADGLAVDVWNRDWTELEPYRGVNANMHTVEALLAAADVTGDAKWVAYCAEIVERVVHGFAAESSFRLPEHFTESWEPVWDYNIDAPAHPFRPYGVTIGHLFEWSRLTLQVRTALGDAAPVWMLEDAVSLFERATLEGWSVDGRTGFIYTTDYAGMPVVRDRLHWVVTEAIAAAWAVQEALGTVEPLTLYYKWWDHARELFIDARSGSWQHELSPDNSPACSVWVGRPDVYHAYQAALLPTLHRITSFAGALSQA